MNTMNPQEKKIFKTTDSELRETFDGKEVTIVSVITEPDATHDAEVLPMYVLDIFHNGKNVEAFKDELEDLPYEEEEVIITEESLSDLDDDTRDELDEFISEAISNQTGFSHYGFTYEIVIKAKLDKSE